MLSLLERYRTRRDWRRTRAEAQHVMRECRRIMKKRACRIPESVAAQLNEKLREVDAALETCSADDVREAVSRLDEQMDKHLAFARKSALREYAESIGTAVAIAIFLRAFVVEAFQIPSGSMIPTLEVGDHIFVSKFAYGIGLPFSDKHLIQFRPPKRGDVIVFKFPKDPSIDYIKRVVGLPGDEIEIRQNQIFVNGEPVPREHVDSDCSYSDHSGIFGPFVQPCDEWIEHMDSGTHRTIFSAHGSATTYGPIKVPDGEVFVMGDNRDNSADSRTGWTVPFHLIKGRALIVWWSRGPFEADFSANGFMAWFKAIRWRRFFTVVN